MVILGGPVPVPPLVKRLDSDNEKIQFWAILALGRLQSNAPAAAPRLREIARSHEAFGLRQAAIMAMTRIPPTDPETKETLKVTLRDPNPLVRRETLQAFIDVPRLTDGDLQIIAGSATDEDEAVASWSEIALPNIRLQRESGSRGV
jgi:HEAT repeat protein